MSEQRIQILDDKTINQIAAGEVIENPASVVKELVENALDSGASEISIKTSAGGRGLISVSDNGKGMSEEDLILSLERHATSKLVGLEDLNTISSLGFRGEALPSIASVSKMTLHTSLNSEKGILLKVEGGKLGSLSTLPRRQGTTVEVKSLFFNVPVRKRFQKSLGWDTGEVHKTLTKFALCYPKIAFSWVNDDKRQFTFSRDEAHQERVYDLLGEEFASSLLPVEQIYEQLSIKGCISQPMKNRPNRTGQYLFINQRAVTSSFIARKVLEGYGTRVPTHRFPLFVLHLTLPPSWVDVNVHPQKREVRLREESKLAPLLVEAIEHSLEQKEQVKLSPTLQVHFPTEKELTFTRESQELDCEQVSLNLSVSEPSHTYRVEEEEPLLFSPKRRILTKIGNYLFIEEIDGMRVVDGKRALERIVYDALAEPKEVQSLLLPVHLTFAGKENVLLMESLDQLNRLGISIRHFGGETFIVDAIPAVLEPDEISDLIYAYLEEGTIPKKIGKCLKRTCISKELGEVIIEQLFRSSQSDYTPNGKIIHHLLEERTLAKFFK